MSWCRKIDDWPQIVQARSLWSMWEHVKGVCHQSRWIAQIDPRSDGSRNYSQFWCQAPPCFQLEGTSACDDGIAAIETKSLEEILKFLNRLQFPLGTSYQHPEAFRGSAVRMLLRHLSQYRRDTILFDDSGEDDFPWRVMRLCLNCNSCEWNLLMEMMVSWRETYCHRSRQLCWIGQGGDGDVGWVASFGKTCQICQLS